MSCAFKISNVKNGMASDASYIYKSDDRDTRNKRDESVRGQTFTELLELFSRLRELTSVSLPVYPLVTTSFKKRKKKKKKKKMKHFGKERRIKNEEVSRYKSTVPP